MIGRAMFGDSEIIHSNGHQIKSTARKQMGTGGHRLHTLATRARGQFPWRANRSSKARWQHSTSRLSPAVNVDSQPTTPFAP